MLNDAEPVDIFGSSPDLPVDEAPEETPEETPAEEEKKPDEEKPEEKEEEEEDGDEELDLEKETDPEKLRAAALRFKKSDEVKSESIKNLRRARRRAAQTSATPETKPFEAPYSSSETTLVKDLAEDEQEKMTETEKRLWDDGVKTKQLLNEEAKRRYDADVEAAKSAPDDIDDSIVLDDEVDQFVKDGAKELANGDRKAANEIIKYYNEYFKGSGLSEDQIIDRLQKAHALTGSYKAPAEQGKVAGKAVKKSGSDAHGVDAIVDSLSDDGEKQPVKL